MSDDYNRGGPPATRGGTGGLSASGLPRTGSHAGGRTASGAHATLRGSIDGWLWPVLLGIAGFLLIHPYDLSLFKAISGWGQSLREGGDIGREWNAWQQYGQGVAIIVSILLLWLLDPPRRRRLLDLALAVFIAQLAQSAGKLLVGRPRPRPQFMDPQSFPGPWGLYPIDQNGTWKLVHAWDRAAGASADLWSMPSSHTLFAFMLSAFLATVYPRGRWVWWSLAALVALGRVVFAAHWPTDVVVGAAVGYAIGATVTRRGLGVRLLDRIWIRWVDRAAQPAWGRLVGPENGVGAK